MNPYFKQPVLIFGVAVPVLLIVVLMGAGVHLRGKLEQTYKVRRAQYVQHKRVQEQREALEAKIRAQDPHMKRWMALFEKPTASNVNSLLGETQKKFEGQEFQQTAFRRTSSSGAIGGASKQASIQIQLAFRGTYRALQNAFLELETRMPQLQLDSIKLTMHPNNRVLNADVNYTAWQNE